MSLAINTGVTGTMGLACTESEKNWPSRVAELENSRLPGIASSRGRGRRPLLLATHQTPRTSSHLTNFCALQFQYLSVLVQNPALCRLLEIIADRALICKSSVFRIIIF